MQLEPVVEHRERYDEDAKEERASDDIQLLPATDDSCHGQVHAEQLEDERLLESLLRILKCFLRISSCLYACVLVRLYRVVHAHQDHQRGYAGEYCSRRIGRMVAFQ